MASERRGVALISAQMATNWGVASVGVASVGRGLRAAGRGLNINSNGNKLGKQIS